jgi:hypothetical protein
MRLFGLFLALILAAEIIALAVLWAVAPSTPTLALAPALPLTLFIALIARRRWTSSAAFRMRAISPEAITSHWRRPPETASPEALSRSIVERANEIRRSLAEESSEIRVEMCTLGYKACVNDMITLTHLTNAELPEAGILRRMQLRRARSKATDALAEARNALPPGALRATRQEQQ